jgi:putative addiction module component (TIGR02574 family)
MRVSDIHEVIKLSTPEKILLVEDLWDSIASDESAVPVPGLFKNKKQPLETYRLILRKNITST